MCHPAGQIGDPPNDHVASDHTARDARHHTGQHGVPKELELLGAQGVEKFNHDAASDP